MLEWIDYEGRRILRMDVHKMTIQQYVQEIDSAAKLILASNPSPGSVLLMCCGEQPNGSLDEAKDAWKLFQATAKQYLKAQAVVGLNAFKRIVARLVMRELYFAASEDDAKRWLVKQ